MTCPKASFRKIYIEALLQINEEYQYSNYFLSKEVCIQTLSDYFAKQKVTMEQEELEDDFCMVFCHGSMLFSQLSIQLVKSPLTVLLCDDSL